MNHLINYPILVLILGATLLFPYKAKSKNILVSDSVPSFSSTITFQHDSCGNLVRKRFSPQRLRAMYGFANTGTKERNTLINEKDILMTTDPLWSNVSINIIGNLQETRCSMEIFSLSGMCVFTRIIDENTISLNLSHLDCRVYLFKFTVGEKKIVYKLSKAKIS